MAFQISIGDALMLSKLAYEIALAFTSGRKSAPAEFQEVQNQLYSLSTALESFKSLSTGDEKHSDQRPVDGISAIIQNCHMTLEHLELLVNKYMVIKDQDDKSKPHKRQWSAEISKNWKKVKWTREGGDLAKLQHNLGVHINSLNLAVAVTNRVLNQKIDRQVDDVHQKLDEIYGWFTSNLKNRTDFNEPRQSFRPKGDVSSVLTFSLYMESPDDHGLVPICENACFDPGWLQSSTNQRVFKCQCYLVGTAYGGGHHEHLSSYSLSSMSLIARLYGPSQSWKIWLSSAKVSKLTPLVIRNINPSQLAVFEEAIADLATTTARQAAGRGVGSLMVFPSVNPYTSRTVISVLNMICYCPGSIEMIQMVHYRNLSKSREWLFNETADVVFYLQPEKGHFSSLDDRVVSLHLTVDCQTRFTVGASTSTVCVHQTDCLCATEAGQENMAKGVNAEIELCDDSAATYFFRQLKYLQEGLLFFKIQQIQRYERLVFQLELGLVMIYNYHLADATLRLAVNVENDVYRLLLSNGSKSISLSTEVPPESLSQIAGTEEPCISLNASCWIAEADTNVTHIYENQKDSTLTCADQDTQQLLALMLQSTASGHRGGIPILGDKA
ncbi:uncharacterized protein N7525_006330 [Penicillium rubens]|uniref:uncharacterized protein n=1 Tax=Penicillium rubens TaxID=1108849 RepID=UPI002A5AF518|nr:uncharacterized protein N7525_006330 [Penicillium rubens]KAJ5828077.1 hypothetical protein N7525_006330 [Penicillium rubens]